MGRISSSIAVVSVDAAMRGWNDPKVANQDISAVVSPGGNNAQAIVQPFYLANPEGPAGFYHPGVAMVPAQTDALGGLAPYLHIVAGFADASIVRDGRTMRGLPSVYLPMDSSGALKLERPYEPLSGSDHPGPVEPDRRAFPIPLPSGAAGARVAVMPNLSIQNPDGTSRQASLAFAWSGVIGVGGNSLVVVDESLAANPAYLGQWPTEPLGQDGSQVPYELPFVTPSVDALTGLMAIPVKFPGAPGAASAIQWFVLDFHQPDKPKVVARVPLNGQFGSLNNGILSVVTANGVEVKKIVDGVAGVDEG